MSKISVPEGYKKVVATYSPVIESHSYDKKNGYFFKLMPGWKSFGYDYIKETSLKAVNEMFAVVENVNQLSIFDFLITEVMGN